MATQIYTRLSQSYAWDKQSDSLDVITQQASTAVVQLNDGQLMPVLGLGTWQSPRGEVKEAVLAAIAAGYRHIDCAYAYGNEQEVGDAIKESIANEIVTREELFITTKLWMPFFTRERVEKCLQRSLAALQLDYVDLYLIHWPMALKESDNERYPENADGTIAYSTEATYLDAWLGMQDIREKGLALSIGVSNFNISQIEKLLAMPDLKVKPAVNQIELHPYLTQLELVDFCHSVGVKITAYSPLGSTPRSDSRITSTFDPLRSNAVVTAIAKRHNKSTAQVLIKYHTQRGIVCVPKSVTKERIEQNANVFDFALTEQDMKELNALNFDCRLNKLNKGGLENHPDYPF